MAPSETLADLAEHGPFLTYREVEELLTSAGWRPCGAGDWAFALLSPGGELVARISPFDPVGPYTARLYTQAAGTGLVPRLHLHRRLLGGADLQVMERLFPAPEQAATEFLARLAVPEPELAELAAHVRGVHDQAQAELSWCGPLDTNPSNIMQAADGRPIMIDPYYADGPNLYALARQDSDRFVTTLPASERRHLTEIPLTDSGPWPAAERKALAEALRRADSRRDGVTDQQ